MSSSHPSLHREHSWRRLLRSVVFPHRLFKQVLVRVMMRLNGVANASNNIGHLPDLLVVAACITCVCCTQCLCVLPVLLVCVFVCGTHCLCVLHTWLFAFLRSLVKDQAGRRCSS